MDTYYTKTMERFWAQTHRENDCIIYTQAIDKDYGRFSFKSKTYRAHRFSYMIHKGDIPEGYVIRHTCDNKLCVNPDHLLLGTHQDNMIDMVNRNRVKWGSEAPKAKLSATQVLEILTDWLSGASQTSLAQKYSVSQASIYSIVQGRSWCRVTGLKYFPVSAYL